MFERGLPSVAITPTLDSSRMPSFARATDSVSAATPVYSSCRIDNAPSSQRPARPLILPPYSRSTGCPAVPRPMLREKNGRPLWMSAVPPRNM